MMVRSLPLGIIACALVACRAPVSPVELVQARPYDVHVPPGYDRAHEIPLVIVLHGYSDPGGKSQDDYFRISEVADRETFLVARPDGTRDSGGNRFWNATDACCDFGGAHVDDVAYLTSMLDDLERRYHVDARRVYVVGHSNGGFMAHRLACELAPRIAAIAELAGAQWEDAARCRPAAKLSVLHIHGDADDIVRYDGGALDEQLLAYLARIAHIRLPSPRHTGGRYPSAHQTVATWAALDGCHGPLVDAGALDLVGSLPGAETTRQAYTDCPGVAVELWTIHGGGHVPDLDRAPAPPAFADAVYAFLRAHPRR